MNVQDQSIQTVLDYILKTNSPVFGRLQTTLGGQIASNIAKFQSKIDGFQAKWLEMKPTGAPSGSADSLMLRFEEVKAQMESIVEEVRFQEPTFFTFLKLNNRFKLQSRSLRSWPFCFDAVGMKLIEQMLC